MLRTRTLLWFLAPLALVAACDDDSSEENQPNSHGGAAGHSTGGSGAVSNTSGGTGGLISSGGDSGAPNPAGGAESGGSSSGGVSSGGAENKGGMENKGGGESGGAGAGNADPCLGVRAREDCEALPVRFDTSTTLSKGCYLANRSPAFAADVTLTLSPGVSILFAEATGLSLSGTQALVAVGTAEDPICLTGVEARRGSWRGITLGRTEGDDHTLEYVTIEYAGSTTSNSKAAAIQTVSDSRVVRLSLAHTTVRESEGYAINLVGSTEAVKFEANTFVANGLGPALVDSQVAGILDDGSEYTGNDVDEIAVRTGGISKNAHWHALGVPFHLDANLNVDVPWTIDAPNTVILAEEKWISINGDEAALHAVGTAKEPIVFTGEVAERGYWRSIDFGGSNNPENELSFVTVEYGGSTQSDANGAAVKAIADSHGVTLSLSHTTIEESQGFGLFLTDSTVTPVFEDNVLTKNTLGPASVGSAVVDQLDTATTYTGNDVDRLRVRTNRIGEEVTWPAISVPYELDGNLHVDSVWTLAPGVTLLMAQDSWIHVGGDEAALYAVGTEQEPIRISGAEATPGFWHSLVFDTTINTRNRLEQTIVEYGGSSLGGGERGMIHTTSDSHGVVLTVTDSVIRHSAQYGIWLGGYTEYNDDIESSNQFSDNTAGDVFRQ